MKERFCTFIREITFFLSTYRRSVVVNSFWLGLGDGIAKLLMFLVTVQVIRYLVPGDYGRLCLATALANMAAILLDFGMTQVIVRDLARHRDSSSLYLSQVITIKMILGLFYFLLLSVLSGPMIGKELIWILLLVGYMNWVQDLSGACIAWFMAEERMEKVFCVQMLHYGGMFLAATVAAWKGLGLEALLGSYVVAALAGLFMAGFMVRREGIHVQLIFDHGLVKYLFNQSWPLYGLLLVSAVMANADTILIGRLQTVSDVGFYQAAYKILFVIQGLTILHTAIFPRLSIIVKTQQDRQKALLNWCVFYFTFLVLIPVAVGATLYAPSILAYVYGSKMLPAAKALKYLIWVGVVYFVKIYIINLFIAQNRQRTLFYVAVLVLGVNLSLNYYLLRHHSFAAAAEVLLISEVLVVVAMLCMMYRWKEKPISMPFRAQVHAQRHGGM